MFLEQQLRGRLRQLQQTRAQAPGSPSFNHSNVSAPNEHSAGQESESESEFEFGPQSGCAIIGPFKNINTMSETEVLALLDAVLWGRGGRLVRDSDCDCVSPSRDSQTDQMSSYITLNSSSITALMQ